MISTFKAHTSTDVGTAGTIVYTTPASTTSVVIGFLIANKVGSIIYADIDVAGISYGVNLPIPSGSTLSALDGKLVMEEGTALTITMDVDTAADVYLSVMEMT